MSLLELIPASAEPVQVIEFRAAERTSTLFSIDLWALIDDATMDLSAVVGRPALFRAVAGHVHVLGGGTRAWSGIVSHVEQVHGVPTSFGQAGKSTYQFHLVPDAWRLTLRRNNRIFQHLSIPDIVDQILREWSIHHTWQIDRPSYPRFEYKVQYAENDHAFIGRLLEEAGIGFVFAWDGGSRSVLTLSDRMASNPPRPGLPLPYIDEPNEASEEEFVTGVGVLREVRPGAVTLRDYDPRHPSVALFARTTSGSGEAFLEQYYHDAGAFLSETGKAEGTPVADDRSFSRHDPVQGKALAERMLHGHRVGARSLDLVTNAYDLQPGAVFCIANHPHSAVASTLPYLAIETRLTGNLEGRWRLSAAAVPTDIPYRPPRVTPKPRVHGVQTATVVGPPGQEVHADEYGRVRVMLPWDRAGHGDDRCSCWVRVAEGWGGAGYGMIALPRIGQEVLLSFLEGDPDQPLILGRDFNAIEQVPYRLPEHRTRSAWKSDSSPGSVGFNEIMFEDHAGRELVWQHAQKDRTRVVEEDEYSTIEHDRRKLIKHDEGERTDGHRRRWVEKSADGILLQDRRERIEQDSHGAVNGNLRELVRGDDSLTVVGDQHERVRGRMAVRAEKQVHAVAEEIIGDGAADVTLGGPGGFLRIDTAGVTIAGTLVKINVTGTPGKGAGCHPAPPEQPEEDKAPSITRLRWSKPKVSVGAEVLALFRVKHFKGIETALVKVFEHDVDGTKKQIDEVSVPVKKTDGDVKLTWARTPEQATEDLAEDTTDGDIGPLEYRFEVEAGALRGDAESGPLWLTNTLIVEVNDHGSPRKDGTKVMITTAEGKRTKTSKGGKVVFQDVLVGTMQVKIEKPRR